MFLRLQTCRPPQRASRTPYTHYSHSPPPPIPLCCPTAINSHRLGRTALPSNRLRRPTDLTCPSSFLIGMRVSLSAASGLGWTACPSPSKPRSKSRSRTEALASILRVAGCGLGACRMSSRRKLASCRTGVSGTLRPACTACFTLSPLRRWHSITWRGVSPES